MRTTPVLGLSLAVGLSVSACSPGTSINASAAGSTSLFGGDLHIHHGSVVRGWMSPGAKKKHLMYVSLPQSDEVDVFALPKYALVGQITDGLEAPEGMATDKKGNLYVTNLTGPTVTVYPRGASTPSLTLTLKYSPADVTITKKDYVLVGDIGGGVDVCPPGKTSASSRLTNPDLGQVDGVGVDGHDNVYAAGYTPQSKPVVFEFAHLKEPGTNLNLSGLENPAGVLVDSSGNLAVSDNTLPGVNIYPPGATSPSATIAANESPDRSAFNRAENLIYVPEGSNDGVNIYDYPTGTFVQTVTISGFARGAILSPWQKP